MGKKYLDSLTAAILEALTKKKGGKSSKAHDDFYDISIQQRLAQP